MIDNEWKRYRRTGAIEMRPHHPGEAMDDISVSDADRAATAHPGGMIARSKHNPHDMWYVNERHVQQNYYPYPDEI